MPRKVTRVATPEPLPVELIEKLKQLVQELGGPEPAARELGLSRTTLGSACAGFPVTKATAALVQVVVQK